jgi:hypothetical protein
MGLQLPRAVHEVVKALPSPHSIGAVALETVLGRHSGSWREILNLAHLPTNQRAGSAHCRFELPT